MTTSTQTHSPSAQKKALCVKVLGVGNAGASVLGLLAQGGMPGAGFVAVNTDSPSDEGRLTRDEAPAASAPAHASPVTRHSSLVTHVDLETKLLRGLGTGGDPERGRALAEEHFPKLEALCEGTDVVLLLAGLGGGAGTGISPVLARAAKEAGALVLAFVTLPFACEGARRQQQAQHGLATLKAAADGVICLPNQKVFKLIDENTSVVETFNITAQLLADAVRGIWRLLTHTGLIEIHFADLAALLRDRHVESAFAVAEAVGPTRSRDVLDKLLAHPMLDGGQALGESDAVLVSLMGGPDLTMAEINRVMEQINRHCEHTQVLMGAALDETFRERLAVTLIAARRIAPPASEPEAPPGEAEQLENQLLNPNSGARPGSRFVPPAPTLPPEQVEQLLARQSGRSARARKTPTRMLQSQLPLEIISKGRFDKSEPTIHKGEDLDVPTYVRRGVALN
jgi:cell division protein FtsZ